MMIERQRTLLLSLLAVLAVVTSCGRQQEDETKPAAYYHLKGQVVALDPASSLVTISHEEIPGFMEAMTMPFSVKDSVLFRGVGVGDSVRGVVAVRRPEMWLDSLTVVWKMPPSEPSC